jgi:23S rRNA (adenine2503-C2)-methyltransferase
VPTKTLLGLTPEGILEIISPGGYNMADALAVAKALYKKRIGNISDFPSMKGALKELLAREVITGLAAPVAVSRSSDGSSKFLFRSGDGREYETVFIPDKKRNTVCVSTQCGCRMGCHFCATASLGFRGNLTAAEIINQVISLPDSDSVTNVVFMGMGEPMDNLEEVLLACNILTSEWGLALGCRNITVSTVGITNAVEEFLKRSDCNITLSLHSPFPGEREKFIPAGKKFSFTEILETMKGFPVKKGRRMSVAYLMIKGLNDTDHHLEALTALLNGSSIRVNLLPYNLTGDDQYESSPDDRIHYFKHKLVTSGISASVRKSRGADIHAACGLLASVRNVATD